MTRPRGRQRSKSRAFVMIAALIACVLTPAIRQRGLLLMADGWSLFQPTPLAAVSTSPATASTPLERQLLAECVRLRSELALLRPASAASERLIKTDAVAGQILWASADGRENVVRFADAAGIAPGALVAGDAAVDLGTAAGVEPDGLVLSGRCVLGRVQRVSFQSCSIQPTTSSDFRIAAEIVRRSGDSTVVGAGGTFVGDDASLAQLENIPAELPVSVGDDVFTTPGSVWSGQRLHLGTIVRAELKPGEPHWEIDVRPRAAIEERARVLVLRSRLGRRDQESSAPAL